MSYSVEEVADLLGIPRPTLYRYLREYSIPHVRRAGRISIPEEGLEKVREARELHLEGLGTAAVRRRLRERSVDPDEIREDMDRLLGAVQGLRETLEKASEAFSPETVHTLLARQSLLSSALYDLNEALGGNKENGSRRRGVLEILEAEVRAQRETLERLERRVERMSGALDANTAAIEDFGRSVESISEMTRYVVSIASLLKNDILLSARRGSGVMD